MINRTTEPLSSLEYPSSEVVLGFVYAVGTNDKVIEKALKKHIPQFDCSARDGGYEPNVKRLSEYLEPYVEELSLGIALPDSPEFDRIKSRMDAGDRLREVTKRGDLLVLAAVSEISKSRDLSPDGTRRIPKPRRVHILLSLKRPEEVIALRRVYGPGFFLVGVFASEVDRRLYLRNKGMSIDKANRLIERDEHEEQEPLGQRTRDTFALADVYVQFKGEDVASFNKQLQRFLRAAFGNPFITPEPRENAMFLAYAASLRSASLSRQVGAAFANSDGEVVGIGCNDVPSAYFHK